MSLTNFFAQLGAPLANSRWSWGAQRETDGAVFLRVWQDEKFVEGGRLHFMIFGDFDASRESPRLGYTERLKHIEAIRAGASCFLVMCIAKDASAPQREIKDFDDAMLFVASSLVERPGRLWIAVAGRKPVDDVRLQTTRLT